ncbi:MAG: S41 family peptidase [Ferruginibacter sp.]
MTNAAAVLKASGYIGFCLLFWSVSCSQTPKSKPGKVTVDLLQKDFSILRKTLEEAHPGLYWYSDKLTMDRYFDSVRVHIDHEMSAFDFFTFLLPVIAKVRCSHTNIHLPPNAIAKGSVPDGLLPFNFFCRNRRVFIREDFLNGGHTGEEVISINSIPVGRIIDTLLKSLPADGFNETYKYYLLSPGAFREGYAAYFKNSGVVNIETQNAVSNKLRSFRTILIKPNELPGPRKVFPPWLELKYRPEFNAAILTINSFEIKTIRFRDSLAGIFKTIQQKNIEHLILDIRENGGGNNENVAELFSYLTSDSFRHLNRAEMNGSNFTYDRYFTNRQLPAHPEGLPEANGKYAVNNRYSGTSFRQPANAARFKGQAILLISGHTSSAASEFAALVRFHKSAVIVGEETGGGYYGGTGGVYINLVLPGSGIEARIPIVRIFNDVGQDTTRQPAGRGTLPDYTVIPTIENILSGKDIQMEAALNQIRKVP